MSTPTSRLSQLDAIVSGIKRFTSGIIWLLLLTVSLYFLACILAWGAVIVKHTFFGPSVEERVRKSSERMQQVRHEAELQRIWLEAENRKLEKYLNSDTDN